jgi:hypothetical protein
MKITNPSAFAYELRDHLKTSETLQNLEPKVQGDLDRLESVESEIFSRSNRRTELEIEISQLNKDYQLYNFRYGLGDSNPDFETNNHMRKETWAKIYASGEEREEIVQKVRSLRIERDELFKQVKQLKSKIELTKRFFSYYDFHVSLFSKVTLEISGEKLSFLLLTEEHREKIWIKDLNSYAVESPIGRACFNKMIGEVFTYHKPNGSDVSGRILDFSLPSLALMEEMIECLENRNVQEKPREIGTFHLHDLYGSNTSRYRKGG